MTDFDDANPFMAFDSIPAIFAFFAKTYGLDATRELLRMFDRDPCWDYRQTLIDSADVLHRLGLIDLAKLLRQHARTVPIAR